MAAATLAVPAEFHSGLPQVWTKYTKGEGGTLNKWERFAFPERKFCSRLVAWWTNALFRLTLRSVRGMNTMATFFSPFPVEK